MLDMAIYTLKQRVDNHAECLGNRTGTSPWNSHGNKV